MLEAALAYAARGWHVFPLKAGTKVPATPNGFKDATTDEETIRLWWGTDRRAGIGIATGALSGLVVVDFDRKTEGLTTYNELAPTLTPTYEVATANGGIHVYYQHPGVLIKNRAGIFQGTDIRGDGGYVCAPPTPGYSVLSAKDLAPLPVWLLDELKDKPQPVMPQVELPEGERGDLNKRTLRFLVNGAPEGQWHQEYYQAAMNLLQNGYTYDEAEQMLLKVTGVLDETHDYPQLLDVYSNRAPMYPPDAPPVYEQASGLPASGGATGKKSLVVRAADLGKAMLSYLADKDKVRGEPTGIAGLDRLLGGGKRLGEITVTHAEAKTGKNTFWHKQMHLWLTRGIPIAYASRELTPESEVLPDLQSLEFQENARLAELDEARRERYLKAVSSWPLYFAEGYGYFPIEEIKEWVEELTRAGVQYFWFDHAHYMLVDPEDHKAASKLIKELKTLAKDKNIHIDLIIQPNKLMDGQRLGPNSIKGGSAMFQAADTLIIMERVKGEDVQRNISKITLDKGRSKLAKSGHLFLQYDPETTDFIEVEPSDPEPTESTPPPIPAPRVLSFQRM